MSMAIFTPLKQIFHPKGDVFHGLKQSDPTFGGFGEAYFTTIQHGEIKGWKQHTKMLMNLIVPVGDVRFYVHDDVTARTEIFEIGAGNYGRLTIPPMHWVAFEGVSPSLNLVLNLASIEHDPEEAINAPIERFPLG